VCFIPCLVHLLMYKETLSPENYSYSLIFFATGKHRKEILGHPEALEVEASSILDHDASAGVPTQNFERENRWRCLRR